MADQLRPELVEAIISEFWYDEHASDDRIVFMTACPLISTVWRNTYEHITSRDIYVPTLAYLFHLCSIVKSTKSVIYRSSLPESARTITCHVDLIESNNDAAMHPYSVLCSLPNYTGFRKCFPNIQYIHLQIRFRIRTGRPFLPRHQLVHTRVSIVLNESTTQLSVLPVDWHVAVDDPPDSLEYDPFCLLATWSVFLVEFTCDMVQCCSQFMSIWSSSSITPAAKGSTYSEGVRYFNNRSRCIEREGDLWDLNYRFRKAARTPINLKNFFSDLYWVLKGAVTIESHMWRSVLQLEDNIYYQQRTLTTNQQTLVLAHPLPEKKIAQNNGGSE
ncbi:uncharacterized protein BT62DRAFT_1023723 [Guyanagaster necrorhizus]|uniref:Uncharacterized protein n=1 Tax=Guyanagaster necrorhizus TaxID=856835 RepID=A0A9P7VTC6_9AGAR|nr:uncharacterized protein BT62DRAFT_1023723 [Guyanagaster necrorhizus MCA 3950]KAG7446070.1 hypothetical protein BT62DRAFT_1023723 [Guyanagaster necrorhizus MCA 3950]